MNLEKKVVPGNQQQNHSEPLTDAQRAMFEQDNDAHIPYGKYKDKTLKWVKANDGKYYQWLQSEGMIEKWFLYKLKDSAMKPYIPKIQPLYTNGRVWVAITEYPTGKVVQDNIIPY